MLAIQRNLIPMRATLRVLLLSFVTLFALPKTADASHIVALEITYRWTGVANQYEVTLNLYRDMSGINAPASINMAYTSSCNTGGSQNFPGTNLGQLSTLGFCADASQTNLDVEKHVYTGIIDLPTRCTDWVFSWSTCCRNPLIDNVDNPGGASSYIKAELDNSIWDHSSMTFDNPPVNYICANRDFYIDHAPRETESDSMRFEFTSALEAANDPVTYNWPNTQVNPLPTHNGITIDERTSVMHFMPSSVFIAQMAIEAEEYRFDSTAGIWRRIGSVTRDFQYSVEAQCVPEDISWGTQSNGAPQVQSAKCGDSTLVIVVDDSIQCGSISPDGSDFRIVATDGSQMAIVSAEAINCKNGITDSILIHLVMPIQPQTGYYIYPKVGFDGNVLLSKCGIDYPEFDSSFISLGECYFFDVDLFNVTVVNDEHVELIWKVPVDSTGNFNYNTLFTNYQIRRSIGLPGPYVPIANNIVKDDTTYQDLFLPPNVTVDSASFAYEIRMTYKGGTVATDYTQRVATMLLTAEINQQDTNKWVVSWTPYNNWSNAYNVFFREKNEPWGSPIATTLTTAIQLERPLTEGDYQIKVETASPNGQFVSESNWYEERINAKTESLCMPNVFTPGGEYPYFNAIPEGGMTSLFNISEECVIGESSWLEEFTGEIYNRWGQLVYSWTDYSTLEAGWDGANAADGTYFYIVKAVGVNGKPFEQNGSFQLIRNK